MQSALALLCALAGCPPGTIFLRISFVVTDGGCRGWPLALLRALGLPGRVPEGEPGRAGPLALLRAL
eukprot:5015336-Lingulodinium_polyedra.AAC.1